MTAPRISADVYAFIDRCQVTTDATLTASRAERLSAVWTCVRSIPTTGCAAEEVAVSSAILRLALGVVGYPPYPSSRHAEHVQVGTRAQNLADRAIDGLTDKFSIEGFTQAALADALRTSVWHLSRTLTIATGFGFSAHLNGMRVMRAALLLRTTDLSRKEIAALVGYKWAGEFDRAFLSWIRMRPTVFRQAVHGVAVFPIACPTTRSEWGPAHLADESGVDLGRVLAHGQPHSPARAQQV